VIGAIIGDVIGSVFESENIKTTDFPLFSRFSRFTDDTVLTVAVADAMLSRDSSTDTRKTKRQDQARYAYKLKEFGRRFPNAGYGQMFEAWLKNDSIRGYRSYANGAAMRVCPIGFAFDSLDMVLNHAKLSAEVTHNHRDGIRGAQAIVSAVFLARTGHDKASIKAFIEREYRYDLNKRLDDIRPYFTFDSAANASVPPAIIAFFESTDFEDAIRKAISIGGDSDTIACMAGGIAQAFYRHIPPHIVSQTRLLLDASHKKIIDAFNAKYAVVF
jgi:ADP-ribosylglycohydrolase